LDYEHAANHGKRTCDWLLVSGNIPSERWLEALKDGVPRPDPQDWLLFDPGTLKEDMTTTKRNDRMLLAQSLSFAGVKKFPRIVVQLAEFNDIHPSASQRTRVSGGLRSSATSVAIEPRSSTNESNMRACRRKNRQSVATSRIVTAQECLQDMDRGSIATMLRLCLVKSNRTLDSYL
jgi:hypothetical protein